MMGYDGPGLLLRGLDGGSPLGFLAAVGTLRTVALAEPKSDWRMRWVGREAMWLPEVSSQRAISPEGLVDTLMPVLRLESTPEFDFDNNLTVSPETFGKVARDAQCRALKDDRRYADFVAAFGCEAVTTDKREIEDTGLRTMSGAGNQHFLGTMKQLVERTSASDLRQSLFNPWTYSNRKLGLRWDPHEDRRYALRWANPSDGDGVPTMRGANRLAIEALPLFPTVPMGRHVKTTGFTRNERTDWFSWPIWGTSIGIDSVRSLLALAGIQKLEPDRPKLHARGVVEIYRSRRITNGKYRNFLPARPA